MVSTLRHCWPKLLSHSAMPSASRGPSYSMGSPGESPKKLEIKIDWFQARIREIFREKTFPWKIAGLFVEPRRCLFVYSFKVLGYKSNDSRLKSATSIHEVLQCRIRRNLAKNPAAKGKWNREYLINTCAYAYVYLFIYIYMCTQKPYVMYRQKCFFVRRFWKWNACGKFSRRKKKAPNMK